MWCTNCRQDVPGVASPLEGLAANAPLTCIRCGQALIATPAAAASSRDTPASSAAAEEAIDAVRIDQPAAFDAWEFEERLKRIKRLVAVTESPERRESASAQGLRFDLGQSAATDREPAIRAAEVSVGEEWRSFFAWSALAGGLAAFTCGGVLSGWSLATARDELWNIGLPTLIGGQLALVVGLMLQLHAASRAKRPADYSATEYRRSFSGSHSTPNPGPSGTAILPRTIESGSTQTSSTNQ